MGKTKKNNKSVVRMVFTSKFFWLTFIFILILIIVISVAYKMIEDARNIYDGLGPEKGFPMSEIDTGLFIRDEQGFLSYDDGKIKSVMGVDVSEYQGEIDWERVKEEGIEFAIIRLGYSSTTDGKIHMDDYYQSNIKNAKAAGIKVGVYFFSQAITVDEAMEEAKYVCKEIRGKGITMPVIFDMEPVAHVEENRISDLTMYEKTEIADAFCSVIEKHGYTPLIYGNPSWIYSSINLSLVTHRDIWLAHYAEVSPFPYRYVMWQYTDSGTVDGINTLCDLDIWFIEK